MRALSESSYVNIVALKSVTYTHLDVYTRLDKSRAIFIWISSNIQYDIDNMFAINFYETKEEKIAKSLSTRKGICENYASIFTDISIKSGLKSFVVEGYTKQNGFADNIPHAWSAALIDTTWYLFDTTWGSGYVRGGKFFKKINNDYDDAVSDTHANVYKGKTQFHTQTTNTLIKNQFYTSH